jgi:hypothetical protein
MNRLCRALIVLGGTVGCLAPAAATDNEPRLERAKAWLQDHYVRQERGECIRAPCPLTKGWMLHGVVATAGAIEISFSNREAAPAGNILAFQSGPGLALNLDQTFCPNAELEIYAIARTPLEIRVHLLDAGRGLVVSHTCTRRVYGF